MCMQRKMTDRDGNSCSTNSGVSASSSTPSSSLTSCNYKATCWKYFDRVIETPLCGGKSTGLKGRVTCKFCGEQLAYHGATTMMNEHLKRKHPTNIEVESKSKQRKLRPVHKTSKERTDNINSLIVGFIARDLRPVNIVNGQGFHALIAYLEPGYQIPTDRYFMGLIERKYAELKEKVKQRLEQQSTFVSITGDIWTSIANDAYLTVTVHYITDDWEMCSAILGTKPLEDRHTGENIVIWVEEMLSSFGIATSKVVAFVHDSGSNIKLAGQLLQDKYGWFTEPCAGHNLQLCVNDGLRVRMIEKAIAAARRLVGHFRRSELATSYLKKRQEQMQTEQHKLIQDVSTRWNSTYHKIDRLLEQRWPVTAVLSDPSVTKCGDRLLDLSTDQWNLLAELKPLLHVLQVATTYLSLEYNVSISTVFPIVQGIVKSMELTEEDSPSVCQFKKTVCQGIKSRWNLDGINLENPRSDLIAVCLDPRFRLTKFLDPHKRLDIQSSIVSLGYLVSSSSSPVSPLFQQERRESSSGPKALDILLGHESDDDSMEITDHVKNEIEDYFKQIQTPCDTSPLDWWKVNKYRYPTLALLAQKYLTITATSTPSERVFSAAGLIVSRLRSSLTPDHVDMLVF